MEKRFWLALPEWAPLHKWPGPVLILVSILFAVVFVQTASHRDLSSLENTLWQVIVLGLGLIGSFLSGRVSAEKAAKDLVKPHARSAFRRLVSLYHSLGRVAQITQGDWLANAGNQDVAIALEKVRVIVVEQIATAGDAIEDWRDIVPEDVNQLYDRYDKLAAKNNSEIEK